MRAHKFGALEAAAEFYALDGGDAENCLTKLVLHAVEDGRSKTHGKACYGALDNAAYAVPCFLGFLDYFFCFLVETEFVSVIRDLMVFDGAYAGVDGDALRFQVLLGQGAGETHGRGESAGGVAAAAVVVGAFRLGVPGKVRVAGAGADVEVGVVLGLGVIVPYDSGDGCSAGLAFEEATKNFREVLLVSGGGA